MTNPSTCTHKHSTSVHLSHKSCNWKLEPGQGSDLTIKGTWHSSYSLHLWEQSFVPVCYFLTECSALLLISSSVSACFGEYLTRAEKLQSRNTKYFKCQSPARQKAPPPWSAWTILSLSSEPTHLSLCQPSKEAECQLRASFKAPPNHSLTSRCQLPWQTSVGHILQTAGLFIVYTSSFSQHKLINKEPFSPQTHNSNFQLF